MEVMVYGDGAFRDPVGRIWELADPVVSPAYTKGLEGTPNELDVYKRQYLGKAARATAQCRTIEQIGKELRNIYEQVLGE